MNIFEKFVERVAGTLLAIIATIYISGFVIVNAYLSRFHIAQIELFQPAFISAGLFFSLTAGFTAILVWPVARAITGTVSFCDSWVQSHQTANAGPNTTGQPSIQTDFLKNVGLIVVVLILIVFLIFVGYIIEITIGNSLVMLMIRWASVRSIDQNFAALLMNIAGLQGLVAIPVFLLIQNWKRLEKIVRDLAITLSVMTFLLVHAYSLLMIADKAYEVLPNNIGGGQPGYVRFYVTPENARRLDFLDNTFEDPEAIIPENYDDGSPDLIVTNRLTLFWQIKSVGLRGEEGEEIYFIRPSTCDLCPVIKIYSSSIYAVAYDEPPNP